ncbi:hypothetical protein KKE06_03670 [Candidatus Micrarchaeota archaeon]|nr:hypothetical protein [Candidatus Micrarchaeota archaeon]MBU1930433.1 hypothetical protein [Candidatus Micrarchaeota archaeon]
MPKKVTKKPAQSPTYGSPIEKTIATWPNVSRKEMHWAQGTDKKLVADATQRAKNQVFVMAPKLGTRRVIHTHRAGKLETTPSVEDIVEFFSNCCRDKSFVSTVVYIVNKHRQIKGILFLKRSRNFDVQKARAFIEPIQQALKVDPNRQIPHKKTLADAKRFGILIKVVPHPDHRYDPVNEMLIKIKK